jgi:hypothetical protein
MGITLSSMVRRIKVGREKQCGTRALRNSMSLPLLSLRVFHFEQTNLDNARQISRLNRVVRQAIMTVPKNDKFKDYARYAQHCLNMTAATSDQELRRVQREMALEWLRLADTVRRPRKSKQMQME